LFAMCPESPIKERHCRGRIRSRRSGTALVVVLGVLGFLAVASASFIASATQSIRLSKKQSQATATFHLCEAGLQAGLRSLWRPFKQNQNFTLMDASCTGANANSPSAALADTVPSVGYYSVGVIGYTVVDTYTRNMTLRAVGW